MTGSTEAAPSQWPGTWLVGGPPGRVLPGAPCGLIVATRDCATTDSPEPVDRDPFDAGRTAAALIAGVLATGLLPPLDPPPDIVLAPAFDLAPDVVPVPTIDDLPPGIVLVMVVGPAPTAWEIFE